ncbi:NucA/NucB deoxyribonuclease domain-containing protein [Streptomyces sp. NPDC005009]
MTRRILLPALVISTFLVGTAVQSTAAAADAPEQLPAPTVSDVSSPLDKERLDSSGSRAGSSEEDCNKAVERAIRAADAVHSYSCLTRLPPAEGKAALSKATATAPDGSSVSAILDTPLPVNKCTGDEDGYWYATRTMQCQIYPDVKYTYRDSNGKFLGTALFATAQQLDLATNSLQWTETDQITMLSSTGTLPADLGVSWTTNCSSTCTPKITKPWVQTPIRVGQNLKQTYTLTDQPSTGYDYIDLDYEFDINSPTSTDLTPPITWGGAEVRCDNKISSADKAGCVVPWYTPTLEISRSQYGSSADMIEWAQNNLSDHWGLRGTGEPLHRLQNKSQQTSNRQAICGTSKFTKDPNIQNDSCDEFPFAGTYESGALNGVDHGKDCAQVTAVRADTSGNLAVDWPTITPTGTVVGSEKCVRGHIPGALNSDAGSAYGVFIKDMLLADDDPFWLRITF